MEGQRKEPDGDCALKPGGGKCQAESSSLDSDGFVGASGELDQDAVLRFLVERGGRARNTDLLEHFRSFLNSPEPQRRARARERFKQLVNAVATVRQEPGSGAKYVQLRKRYRDVSGVQGSNSSSDLALASPAKVSSAAVELPDNAPRQSSAPQGASEGSRDGDTAHEEQAVVEPPKEEADGEGTTSADISSAFESQAPEDDDSGALLEANTEVPLPRAPEMSRESPGAPAGEGNGWGEQSSPPRRAAFLTPEGRAAAEAEEPCRGAQLEQVSPPSASPDADSSPGVFSTDANTPRCGRKNFRERMLGSSPRGGFLPRGGSGSSRGGDSDNASIASSSAEDEGGGSIALDPLEHEWMLCASDGRWESLESLLSCEPALLTKRDFITGFTCLHWAAKLGHHELLARLVNFAHQQRLPVNINARTSGGYTALHLAAMHGHLEVVKLLVGACDADVEIRDYSGRKASHYLSQGTAEEVGSLVGALQEVVDSGAPNGSSRWKLSKVLPSNFISYKLSHHHIGNEVESGEGTAGYHQSKEFNRKTSGSSRIKPRLNKIRFRTQIIHNTPSFKGDTEGGGGGGEERSLKASFKIRPKSNVFG